MSMPKTRFKRCAQVMEARRSAGVLSSNSFDVVLSLPFPRLPGVTCARCLLFGANTPWNVRLTNDAETVARGNKDEVRYRPALCVNLIQTDR